MEYLCFIDKIGTDSEGMNIYRFDFTEDKDNIWGEFFNITPAGIVPSLRPDKSYITHEGIIRFSDEMILAKQSACFSMQDSFDGIISLGFFTPINYEKPIMFNFGDTYDNVIEKLNKMECTFEKLTEIERGNENIINSFIEGDESEEDDNNE